MAMTTAFLRLEPLEIILAGQGGRSRGMSIPRINSRDRVIAFDLAARSS